MNVVIEYLVKMGAAAQGRVLAEANRHMIAGENASTALMWAVATEKHRRERDWNS